MKVYERHYVILNVFILADWSDQIQFTQISQSCTIDTPCVLRYCAPVRYAFARSCMKTETMEQNYPIVVTQITLNFRESHRNTVIAVRGLSFIQLSILSVRGLNLPLYLLYITQHDIVFIMLRLKLL